MKVRRKILKHYILEASTFYDASFRFDFKKISNRAFDMMSKDFGNSNACFIYEAMNSSYNSLIKIV